jgi:hypothetical protein
MMKPARKILWRTSEKAAESLWSCVHGIYGESFPKQFQASFPRTPHFDAENIFRHRVERKVVPGLSTDSQASSQQQGSNLFQEL